MDFTDPQAWQDIYGFRKNTPENRKDERDLLHESPFPDVVNADREHHAALRRLLSHGFSDKALREQQPTINAYVGLLLQRLGECAAKGEKVDILDWYNVSTFATGVLPFLD